MVGRINDRELVTLTRLNKTPAICRFSFCIIFHHLIVFSFLQVGLAVDDIKGVQEKAVLKRLAMQVGLFMHTLFLYAQGRFLLRGKRLFLSAVQVKFSRLCHRMFIFGLMSFSIVKTH